MHQLGLQSGGVGYIRHHHHQAGDVPLLIPHGTQVHRELSNAAITAQNLHIQVIHLMAGNGRADCFTQRLPSIRSNKVLQRTPEQLPLLIAHVIPSAIGVADQPGGIGHQNQALRVV